MKETESFIKYEKVTRVMNLAAKVGSVVLLAAGVVLAIAGIFVSAEARNILYISALVAVLLYFAIMFPMLIISIRRRGNITLYRSYSRVLARNPHNAVGEISDSCGLKRERIIDDLTRLDALGFFESITIDRDAGTVDVKTNEAESGKEFICPVCGGKTALVQGQESKCAFCGAVKEISMIEKDVKEGEVNGL